MYDDPNMHDRRLEQADYRRISGVQMVKDFPSMGDAIREFERITGDDVIGHTDQDGCAIYWFMCPDEELIVAGWECGKYLYERWADTPRKVLEMLNNGQMQADI